MNMLVVLFSVLSLAAAKPSGFIAEPILAPAPVAIPAAVSSQSRIDIKSSPAYIAQTYVAPAPIVPAPAPVAYTAPFVPAPAPLHYAAPAPALYAAPAPYIPTAYSHTSQVDFKSAPGFILPEYASFLGHPAVPLDTPEVAAAKAAHFEAKALAAHSLKKRSVAYAAPLAYATPLVHSAPLIAHPAPLYHAPLAYTAPLTYTAPLITKTYSVHPY